MKKEENQKTNPSLKKANDFRSRSQSPKAYLGCDTCKLKNSELSKVKSISKLSECSAVFDKNKFRKPSQERVEKGFKKPKIKLTDLCDEDKKRIVELIEELTKLAEMNQELKESLDSMRKSREEQQEYIMKQANIFLEEKNFYINEINQYKIRIEAFDNEMKNKMFQWNTYERRKHTEMAYLAKALQKALKEKHGMNGQLSHLRTCLKHSLESFQKLRAEVTELQLQEQKIHCVRKFKSVSCQTEPNGVALKEKSQPSDGDTDEEFLSTCNQDAVNAKSSLDIINEKLEYVYQLLKRRSESYAKHNSEKLEIDLSALLKDDKLMECENENFQVPDDLPKGQSDEEISGNGYRFLKPFDQSSKTSTQAERMLKKIGKPLNSVVKECSQKQENNKLTNSLPKDSPGNLESHSNYLQNKIAQRNNPFKPPEDRVYDEDRLLEELFYSDHGLNFGLDSILKLESNESFQDPTFS